MTAASPRPAPTKPLLAALAGVRQPTPPLWLMRQAGRYLPEYRAIRAKAPSFLDFCYTPELATEATLQPIRRFGFDAAILFCDILVVPDALGQSVSFEEGEGPRLEPIETAADLAALRDEPDWSRLAPVFETLARAKAALPDDVALIGFCGAPWTVASYMIAGRGTPDQAPARLFAYRQPDLFAALIDRLVELSAAYLERQLQRRRRGGADFRLLGGRAAAGRIRALVRRADRAHRRQAARRPARRADHRLSARRGDPARQVRRIDGLAAIGLDTAVEPRAAAAALPARFALQGNLDPLALLAGGRALDEGIDARRCRASPAARIFQSRPWHSAGDADRPCRAARGARARRLNGEDPLLLARAIAPPPP